MRLVTVAQAAQILAVSASTVRELAHQPDFPILRINAHCHRIDADRLEAWVAAHLGQPAPTPDHAPAFTEAEWEAQLDRLVAANILEEKEATNR